jgi:hypothetical protein
MRCIDVRRCLRVSAGLMAGGLVGLVLMAAAATAADSVCFEAEKATLSGVMQKDCEVGEITPRAQRDLAKDASGKHYIGVPEDGEKEAEPAAGQGKITFSTDKAGAYTFWIRAWWLDSCANSFTIQIDDLPPFEIGQDTQYQRWHWVHFGTPLPLTKTGQHTLIIKNHEDGALADQFFLTTTKVIPQGKWAPTQ